MSEPVLRDVQCGDSRGLQRMACRRWGDAANPKLLLRVRGLPRQGRDLDAPARPMRGEYRIVCVGPAPTLVHGDQIGLLRRFPPAPP